MCADKNLRKEVSKLLGAELGFLYIDVDEVLDYELLNYQEVSLEQANEKMRLLEIKSIKRALDFKNCIITASRDLFVANDNFKLFNNAKKIFINLSKGYFVARANWDKHRVEQELSLFEQINKIIINNCDIVIEKEVKSTIAIKDEIILALKKS